MSCNNRNVSVGLSDDGLGLSLRYGMALCSVTFKIKYDIFTPKATQIRSQGNVCKFPYRQIASIQITCMLWLLTRLFIHVYIWICVCVFLQAYRFLAINKKLGLSGRPERPVGCIGTCKVFANTPTHMYVAVHVHTHGMYAPCCPAAQVRGEHWTHFSYIDLHTFPELREAEYSVKSRHRDIQFQKFSLLQLYSMHQWMLNRFCLFSGLITF